MSILTDNSKALQYLAWDPNPETCAEVKSLLDASDQNSLSKILDSRLAFGTAGLRGPMGAGYNRMNDIVILQTSQGLLRYLEEDFGENARTRGVVIGYDHRRRGTLSSLGFARMCAAVFLSQGFKVYLLENLVCTPFVAFAVTHLGCVAGVMVTASHNPKADNGFKVYWDSGSQIIPPHDERIALKIQENLMPWQSYDTDAVVNHPNTLDVTATISDAYFSRLASLSLYTPLNEKSALKIVYTAMHGVGFQWIRRAFEVFKHPSVVAVDLQVEPDPEFSTVTFPNPEEKGALDEAIRVAESCDSTLIVANDPDADRLAVAEKFPALGTDEEAKWHVFTGNELGVLLGHWQITRWQAGGGAPGAAVLASVVSSRMLRRIAQVEGMTYYDTLTGFKWLGSRALELRAQGTPVLFAYEEALGFCVGDLVCDKDGVSAAAVFVEMATWLAAAGGGGSSTSSSSSSSDSAIPAPRTVHQHLQALYAKYGEFVSYNSYVFCYDPKTTARIFERLRSGDPTPSPAPTPAGVPTSSDAGPIRYWGSCAGARVVSVKDVTKGFDTTAADGKSDLPVTPDSEMIMFEFNNGVSVTLRTSGTEPKIKFYTEIAGQPGQSRHSLEQTLRTFVDLLVDEMLQPVANGLTRP